MNYKLKTNNWVIITRNKIILFNLKQGIKIPYSEVNFVRNCTP